MKRVRVNLLLWAALMFVVLVSPSAFGWGQYGHRFITSSAISDLPEPLRTYFKSNANRITNNAAIEPPGTHFIDIDYYPEFFAHTFPQDVNVLIAQYGATTVTNNGMGPWTAVTHYETLRSQFAVAQTAADWTNLLVTAATLAHFLEDLHNPMHLATNYNGQYTGQTGLHSRYESTMIQNQLAAGLTLSNNVTDCVYYTNILDAIFEDIYLVYPYNATILAADLSATLSTNYYQHLWDDGCSSFTPMVMQRAAGMVASAWYSAWRDAGFPQPPGVAPSILVTLKTIRTQPNSFQFIINGDAGQKLTIQSSPDLLVWTHHAVVTNLDGRIDFTAPLTLERQRYYRVAPSQ